MLLVFVRLTHDRRFVVVILFLFVVVFVVFVVFIRVSGRHRVAHDHEGTPVDRLGGKFLGDARCHVVAPPTHDIIESSRAELAAASASIA
jgi:hypothetical protein